MSWTEYFLLAFASTVWPILIVVVIAALRTSRPEQLLVAFLAGGLLATIGIFGPTSPWHWAPLNPLAAIIETKTEVTCRPCHKPTCRMEHHRCMRDIPSTQVLAAVHRALGRLPVPA